MTIEELSAFLEKNRQVEWTRDEEGNFYFRHTQFDRPEEKVKVESKALTGISVAQLEKILIGGRDVDQITRITGYFSRVSGWNKGKRGELADRHRAAV